MASTDASVLDDFQASWGRQFALAAEALAAEHSRESVRISFVGNGESIAPELVRLRLNHRVMGLMGHRARRALLAEGMDTKGVNELLIARMKASQVAVESEWGKAVDVSCRNTRHLGACPPDRSNCILEKWEHLDIPCINVTS